ncbi:MAG: hypothetical protein IPM53_31560 [Anaerolineaceae bacterium]|nr:hypothetical protein [Anaerolineaceae bacterium]
MNSNFEWQKHQVNERVQTYRKEAAAHRLAAKGNGRKPVSVWLKLAILAGIFFMMWLTVGCTADNSVAEVDLEPQSSGWVMADRIDFQDKREAYLSVATAVGKDTGWTMAQRIHFQDKREAYLDWRSGTAHVTGMTMAERILFQDSVLGGGTLRNDG